MMTAEQLKGSILQLAIQGKLVEQKPEEGTGEEFYRKTAKRKGNNSNLEEYPIDIPETWYWVQLDEVCDIYTGNSISENVKKNKYMKDIEGYPYIATKDVQFDNTVEYDNGVIIPIKEDFRHAYKGAVLMCIEGGSAGRKIALINRDVCFGNKLCMFYSLTVSNQYIYHYLQSPLFQSAFRNGITGIIGGVSIKKIKSMWLPLPPLSEQKRIVARIEKLMPFVEQYAAASTKLNSLNASFPEMMKKSILQEAVQGKLVPQDPNDEPASLLLKKIAEEKKRLIKEGKIKKQKPLPEITEDEIPFEIPESWEWVKLEQIAKSITDGDHQAPPKTTKGVPFLVISNVSSGNIDFTNTRYVPDEYYNALSEERKADENDILFTVTGSYGIPVKVNTTNKFCFQRHIALIKPLMNTDYLTMVLGSPLVKKQCDATATGTAQKTVGLSSLRNFMIPIPPLNEQKRILERLKEVKETTAIRLR